MNSFVTVLSSDNYLEGVLVLNESLKRVNSKESLTVLVSNKISNNVINSLTKNNIKIIENNEEIKLPDLTAEKNRNQGVGHWNNTFDKLKVFGLDMFETIVYLDSDMLVVENIDDLFDKPHMSAVVAGRYFKGNESWVELNSGLMVIKPSKELERKLISYLPIASLKRDRLGDQDVLQEYFNDWKSKPELQLDDKYNMFSIYLDYYGDTRNYSYCGYGGKSDDDTTSCAVIHFMSSKKPWMHSINGYYLRCIKRLISGRLLELKAFNDYRRLLGVIEK